MKTSLILALLAAAVLGGCGDDASSNTNTNANANQNVGCEPACEAWETCSTERVCLLLEGRCNGESDCVAGVETCTLDSHTCEPVAVTCNEDRTPSAVTLPTDACGALTDCLESAECGESQRCENVPVDGQSFARACCVEGPRGCQPSGETCTNEFDCESGLCVARNDGQTYCTHLCDGPEDCAAPISDCADLFIMTVCVEP